ncbi:MAG: hypothetical protein MZV64_23025 [Ignavibacteriales bacterium]|nr:hypothetical protein [Ignavibacteriales bacterium]
MSVFCLSRKRRNRYARSVRSGSSTRTVILMLRVAQAPSPQYMVEAEYRMPLKPTF